ncbi:restriction endonuclease subunit S [Escherichia coli]|uniref:restriction endonuclease subunit S n=1 Tax=Enterobacteriaceae TaxID=543 RepID=UPI000678DD4E|nr:MULTISPECIES: restriction endonuclease subunit S [Enterobacteriaceae]EEW1793717.1 restriction endonuclease subunit S [Escherichia coli]EEW1802718.1 restriction endonuclease subunit S [Escherichia coli]EEW2202327.1 restriction endonuclease subunit S [Escherichia coli]EFH8537593.1 restriction endonuclease subunit S [Escherichia coli]EFN4574999.1 restriction endonuclease subunit S [Escherichia coli]
MSELSYLEKLLDGVEVEWKSLGDVVNFQRGRRLVKSQLETRGKYAVYQNSMTPLGYYHEYNVAAQSSFIICAGAAGEIGYSENEFWAADDVHFAITPEYINDRFLFHFLLTQKNKISGQVRRASIPRLSKSVIEKLEFPIPCPDNPEKSLAIQSEIVRILDKFTALTAELTAELNMRKKQYNYYRDQLLSFKEGEVEWKTLGDLGENLDSKRKPITSGLREAGSIPYYGASGIVDYVKDYIFDGDFLLISEDGANLLARNTPIAFSISGKSWVNNHAHVIKFDSYAERRYVEYYLNSIDLSPYISGAAQPKLNKKNLESIRIPNPSPEDKERIVSILDKFDALTNSINEGLPREIELRQKQYEYYRDLLFSFPRPETASN